MNDTEKTKRVALFITAACILCSLIMLLPPVQNIVLCLLEKLKGGTIRWPDLWRGRIRSIACVCFSICICIILLLFTKQEKRKKVFCTIFLLCAAISSLLYPLQNRIAFLQFFGGLPLEKATDPLRTRLFVYKTLVFTAIFCILAFFVNNVSSYAAIIKSKQSYTVLFSVALLLSFISFNLGIPKHATGYLNNFWMFYAGFDFGDYIETILKPYPNFSYPPLANILTKVLRLSLPSSPDIVATWNLGYTIFSPVGSFMILVFFVTHLFPLLLLCHRAIQGNTFTKVLFTLTICMSSFFVYAIMRGNIILLATSFSLYYMIFYDSKDKRLKQTALLSLAIAANIKVYPAIFGCLLIKEKRWKDIGLCILYSALLFFPLFFTYDEGFTFSFSEFMKRARFAGSDKISAPPPQIVPPSNANLLEYEAGSASEAGISALTVEQNQEVSEKHSKRTENKLLKALTAPAFGFFSLSNTVATFTKALQAPRKVYTVLLVFSFLSYIGLSVLLFIRAKRKWILFLIPATACYLIPGMTYCYVPIFLLLPLIALLNEDHKRPSEYGALLLFLCMFACNWTIWPCVLGYRQFPSIAFSVGLYVTAFLAELQVPKNKGIAESTCS